MSLLSDKYRVTWYHLHQGNSVRRDRRGKPYMTVAHVIDRETQGIVGEGLSYCSKLDAPNKHTGLCLAVGRAFLDAMSMEYKDPRFGKIVKGEPCHERGVMPRPKKKRVIEVVLSPEDYDEVMGAGDGTEGKLNKGWPEDKDIQSAVNPFRDVVDDQKSVAVTDPGVQSIEDHVPDGGDDMSTGSEHNLGVDLEHQFKSDGER